MPVPPPFNWASEEHAPEVERVTEEVAERTEEVSERVEVAERIGVAERGGLAARVGPQRVGGSVRVPRRLAIAAWTGLVVAVIAPLVVLVATDHTGRFVAMLLFVLLIPGTAVTCWLDTGDGFAQTALTITISIATYALAASILIWASAWHPNVVFLLAIPSGLSCLRRLVVSSPPGLGGIRLRARLGR